MKIDHITRPAHSGFTLVELMVTIAIFSFVIAASYATYINFIHSTTRESQLTSINADAATTLKLLERDIKMAGFGLPQTTRAASHNNCNVSNEDFCKNNTDRIFMADGWEILRDFTLNKEDDGQIPTSPDYYSKIANSKANGGYRAQLTSDASLSATSVAVDVLNIDSADERDDPDDDDGSPLVDIKDNKSFIISDNIKVEGHRIGSLTGTTINLLSNESLNNTYLAGNSSVAPALGWYVRKDSSGKKYPNGDNIYWLYRNQNRVIPYVDNLQIQYGYDAFPNSTTQGGIQSVDWADTMPPPSGIPDGESLFQFNYLRAIKIILTIKVVDRKDPAKIIFTNFETTVDLKN
ncbi:MAG: type II secretion system protein [Nitrospirae bacterium]|nr:type II secretion system protein [Nitrospirota bacterium]